MLTLGATVATAVAAPKDLEKIFEREAEDNEELRVVKWWEGEGFPED